MQINLTISTYEGNTLLFTENTIGTIEDDYLIYNTDTDSIKINLIKFKLIKENIDTIFKLTKETCTLTLKEINKSININIDYINYENENNKNVKIEYKLESQEEKFKIYIEIGEIINEI